MTTKSPYKSAQVQPRERFRTAIHAIERSRNKQPEVWVDPKGSYWLSLCEDISKVCCEPANPPAGYELDRDISERIAALLCERMLRASTVEMAMGESLTFQDALRQAARQPVVGDESERIEQIIQGLRLERSIAFKRLSEVNEEWRTLTKERISILQKSSVTPDSVALENVIHHKFTSQESYEEQIKDDILLSRDQACLTAQEEFAQMLNEKSLIVTDLLDPEIFPKLAPKAIILDEFPDRVKDAWIVDKGLEVLRDQVAELEGLLRDNSDGFADAREPIAEEVSAVVGLLDEKIQNGFSGSKESMVQMWGSFLTPPGWDIVMRMTADAYKNDDFTRHALFSKSNHDLLA